MKGQKTGGRTRGTPNRRTQQKQMLDELMREHGEDYVAGVLKKLQQAPRGTTKGLDMLRELAVLAKNCVAIYQPKQGADGKPQVEQPERLQSFLGIAVKAVAELTRYESPTFKAIAVQEVPAPVGQAVSGESAKVIGLLGKRSQQDAANAYMRLVRNDPKVA